jgi:hypothetical protein
MEMSRNGSGYRAKNMWSFMASLDTWLAPVQIKVGPDGALWVSDFYSLVAQHNPTPTNLGTCCPNGPGNAYETPNRNAASGRIYRISYKGAPAAQPMRLDNASAAQLVAALRNDNMFWRLTAQRLLVERGQRDVVPALIALVNDHTIDRLGLNNAALHALWTLDGLGAIKNDPNALKAARNALNHPAGALRRAALMILPRTPELENDIFTMGMLPDRRAPHETGSPLAMAQQQDADPGVRLEALLVLSELRPSERAAAALMDVLFVPQNARDPWIPDAVGIAGSKHGLNFLTQVIERRVQGTDRAVFTGIGRAVDIMTRTHVAPGDPALAVRLIEMVPKVDQAIGTLTPEQRKALVAARTGSAAELAASFTAVAQRWTLADVFTAQ